MPPQLILLCIAMFAPPAPATAEAPSEIAVTITPLRDVYHVGEPIAAMMVVKNTSDREFHIAFSYPRHIFVNFTATRSHAPEPAARYLARLPGTPVFSRLAPGAELRRTIALNRFLTLTHPGEYSITYLAHFLGPLSEAREDGGRRILRAYKSSGKFAIDLKPGATDEAWIKELIAALDAKPPDSAEGGDSHKPKLSTEEAAELLLWADTPIVIDPLISAAKNAPIYRNFFPADVVNSLVKFFKKHESARTGILEIADHCTVSTEAYDAALAVYQREGVPLPISWFKRTLASKAPGRRYIALQYLLEHAQSEDLPEIEPLARDENPEIARMAKAVVERIKAREAGKTPAAKEPKDKP